MNSGAWQATIHAVTELDMTGRLSLTHSSILGAFQVALVAKNLCGNAGNHRDSGSIPGLGKVLGGGNGNPFQCSCLKNPHR